VGVMKYIYTALTRTGRDDEAVAAYVRKLKREQMIEKAESQQKTLDFTGKGG
jgi:hypothetical protein